MVITAIDKHNKTSYKKSIFCLWLFFLNGLLKLKVKDIFEYDTNIAIYWYTETYIYMSENYLKLNY